MTIDTENIPMWLRSAVRMEYKGVLYDLEMINQAIKSSKEGDTVGHYVDYLHFKQCKADQEAILEEMQTMFPFLKNLFNGPTNC